jgi:hypothetical protein
LTDRKPFSVQTEKKKKKDDEMKEKKNLRHGKAFDLSIVQAHE